MTDGLPYGGNLPPGVTDRMIEDAQGCDAPDEPGEIKVEYVAPPIPTRAYDWKAWREDINADENSLVGWGASSADAVADLLQKEAEA
jgi:hypothetical protein